MANLNELKKYLDYEFSTGVYTGDDYKKFQTKYLYYLGSLCKKQNWQLIKVSKGHYNFSAFIRNQYRYLYISIPDVRYNKNGWYNHVLIRTAKNVFDYTGGTNNYTNLERLTESADWLFKRWEYET